MNIWVHEKGHQDDPETSKPLGHVQLIIDESNHETFEKTTEDYKDAALGYASILLNKAIDQGIGVKDVNEMIDAVNNSPLGNVGFLYYDEESNKVTSILSLEPVEIEKK